MERYDPDRMELSTRDVVSRSIATEILEGRGSKHGGVYLDVTHLPAEEIERRLPIMLEQFLQFGVDIRVQPMEVAPTAHHLMGGLKITPDAATTLPGLYACGEVTGGIHGANRLGGNALADTQVFGKRAGEAAGKAPVTTITVDIDEVLAKEAARCDAYCSGTTPPHVIARELKQTMWDNAGIFRTEAGLKEAEATVSRLQNLVPKAATRRMLGECCIVTNMLTVARLITHGALLREESRGAHVRTDITQGWTPADSPFGHTVQSLSGTAIETRENAA